MWRSKLQRSETTGVLAANNPLRRFEHTLSAQRIGQNNNVVLRRLGSRQVCHVFCLLLSHLSSGFWPYPLSPGLAISALACLDFVFHLLSSVIYLSWPHLYLAFAHVQTISSSIGNGGSGAVFLEVLPPK